MGLHKVIQLAQTCGASPSQWEGITDNSEQVYIRYRWGILTVNLGAPNDTSEFAGVKGKLIFRCEHGDAMDGYMDTREMSALVSDILKFATPIEDS